MKKIAIIGAGGMAHYHIKGFRAAGADVVAIVDINQELSKKFADKYNLKYTFKKLDDCLKVFKDLDGVSIAVPNAFHKPIVIDALEKGLSVFCEKPPALDAKEMYEIELSYKNSGKLLMFDFNNRAREESQILKHYIDNDKSFKINTAQAYWIRRNGIPGIGGWFTNKKLSGGGPAIDLLHMLDLSLYFMNYPRPKVVIASSNNDFMENKSFKGPWGIVDNINGITDVESAIQAFITFDNGTSLILRNSWAELIEREKAGVCFQGNNFGGLMERVFKIDGIDETSTDICKIFTYEGNHQVDKDIKFIPDFAMGREASAINFIESLEGKVEPLNKPEEAVRLMEIVDAIYESAKTGLPIIMENK